MSRAIAARGLLAIVIVAAPAGGAPRRDPQPKALADIVSGLIPWYPAPRPPSMPSSVPTATRQP
jgi:hypothetical protein